MSNSPTNDNAAGAADSADRPTGFVYDPLYLEHHTGPGHPERPERLTAILRELKESALDQRLLAIKATAARREQVTAVHAADYLDRVVDICRRAPAFVDSPDVPVSKRSWEVALLAAGGVLAAVDAVVRGKAANAFCAVRPPGHHALVDQAMGFCLINNVAIAARHLQQRHKLAKVLIVDWDVHHGNGTQDIFYRDGQVFYFSVHQFPFYPGSGRQTERGEGPGLGATLNVPLPAGSGDRAYLEAFERRLEPAAVDFHPDFVLISAGFDAHEDDILGQMEVTTDGFAALTRVVRRIAEQCCQGRIVSVLEGGYDLKGLAASVAAHVRELSR